MQTIKADGAPRIHAATRQGECIFDPAEPVPRDAIQPATLRPPDPRTEWQRAERFRAGGFHRVDANRLDAFNDEIRHRAERELARL